MRVLLVLFLAGCCYFLNVILFDGVVVSKNFRASKGFFMNAQRHVSVVVTFLLSFWVPFCALSMQPRLPFLHGPIASGNGVRDGGPAQDNVVYQNVAQKPAQGNVVYQNVAQKPAQDETEKEIADKQEELIKQRDLLKSRAALRVLRKEVAEAKKKDRSLLLSHALDQCEDVVRVAGGVARLVVISCGAFFAYSIYRKFSPSSQVKFDKSLQFYIQDKAGNFVPYKIGAGRPCMPPPPLFKALYRVLGISECR